MDPSLDLAGLHVEMGDVTVLRVLLTAGQAVLVVVPELLEAIDPEAAPPGGAEAVGVADHGATSLAFRFTGLGLAWAAGGSSPLPSSGSISSASGSSATSRRR